MKAYFLWPINAHLGPNITASKLVTLKISTILVCGAALLSGNEAACSENEILKISRNVWFEFKFPIFVNNVPLVVVPGLLPNPFQPYSCISSDFDRSCFCGSHSLLDWLHKILGIANQHFCSLNVFFGALCTQHCCFYSWQDL